MSELGNGLILMILGMLFVGSFLWLMILCMNLSARICASVLERFPQASTPGEDNGEREAEIALAVALSRHRQT